MNGNTKLSEAPQITLDDIVNHVISRLRAAPVTGVVVGQADAVVDRAPGCGSQTTPCAIMAPACTRSSLSSDGAPADGRPLPVGARRLPTTVVAVKSWEKSRFYNTVLANGELWNPYTFRRWLPRQYLAHMAAFDNCVDRAYGRTISSRKMLKFLADECEKLAYIENRYRIQFEERRKFLTIEDVRCIVRSYVRHGIERLDNRSLCVEGKKTKKGQILYSDILDGRMKEMWVHEVIDTDMPHGETHTVSGWKKSELNAEATEALQTAMTMANVAETYTGIREAVLHLPVLHIKSHDSSGAESTWLPSRFKEMYKKTGAYYTLKSLIVSGHIVFHDEPGLYMHRHVDTCPFPVGSEKACRWSLDKLLSCIDREGYELHAILKRSMERCNYTAKDFLTAPF